MIGKIICGRFVVTELIGSGGMANVYKATDEETSRPVALKALKDEFAADQEFVRRFEREAEAVISLSHDNIVRSLGVFEEDSMHFIALEYIEGVTAKEQLREQGKLEARKAVHLATQICDALTHAHERGIIHRDIKPQNVLLTPRGRVKLTDFGIARDASASTVTFAGNSVMGSVHYISPEQARGESVDAKSDIYSLGITLYELVTGTLPYTGDTNVSIALKHLSEPILPPIELEPKMPKSLNDIIMRATNKDPAKRYASAREMKQDLLRCLREPDGKFVKLEREEKPKKRGLRGMSIAFMAFVGLGMLLVLFFIARSIFTPAPELYVPNLRTRLENEAVEYGQSKGFNVLVGERVRDEGSAKGTVIAQSPREGSSARVGDTIVITVSEGPTVFTVPKLEGLTLDQAIAAIQAEGLILGEITYELSPDVPEGCVARQDPPPGEEPLGDEPINLWVNDDPANHTEVPSVTGFSLDEALLLAQNRGFDNIFVREVVPEGDVLEGTVLSQTPLSDEIVPKDTRIELTVSKVVQRDYSADLACNLEIELPSTNIMVTFIDSNGAQYVLYDEALPPGPSTVSVKIESNDPKDKTVIFYENGSEMRRETAEMTPKNH